SRSRTYCRTTEASPSPIPMSCASSRDRPKGAITSAIRSSTDSLGVASVAVSIAPEITQLGLRDGTFGPGVGMLSGLFHGLVLEVFPVGQHAIVAGRNRRCLHVGSQEPGPALQRMETRTFVSVCRISSKADDLGTDVVAGFQGSGGIAAVV